MVDRRSKRRLEEYLAKKASSSLAKAAGQPDEQPVSNTDIELERIAHLPDEKSCHRPTTNCKIRSGEVPSFSVSGIEKCPMPLDEGPFSLDAMISPTTIISRRPGPDHDPASGSPVQYDKGNDAMLRHGHSSDTGSVHPSTLTPAGSFLNLAHVKPDSPRLREKITRAELLLGVDLELTRKEFVDEIREALGLRRCTVETVHTPDPELSSPQRKKKKKP